MSDDPSFRRGLPFGNNTIVIPFTWSPSQTGRLRLSQTPDLSANAPFSKSSPLGDPGIPATADAPVVDGRAAADAGKSNDATAPVLVVDDLGKPVLIPDGPYKGKPMLRPAGLDPHFFIGQGATDWRYYNALLNIPMLPPDGDGVGPAILTREFMQLRKFSHYGEWDAQRVGGRNHAEYVDYTTVAIGLYASAAGISLDEVLTIENTFAAIESRFAPDTKMDGTYTHLPRRNVLNTELGFQLYQSGRIQAGTQR